MSRVRVSTDDPDIWTYTFEGFLDEEAFAKYLQELERPLACRAPFAVITVASSAVAMPLGQRQRLAEWLQQRRALLKRHVTGAAFVSPSPKLRFILSTIIVIEPIPMPYVVTSTLDEARAWVRASLSGSVLSGAASPGLLAQSPREVVSMSFAQVSDPHRDIDKQREL